MIAIGSDHGGYALKEHIKAYLTSKGITCLDVGCNSPESCDYPIFGKAVGEAVASGQCERVLSSAPPASAFLSLPTRLRASAQLCAPIPLPLRWR